MLLGIPLYPLIVAPLLGAGILFWRRARWHLAVLRAGQPLNRLDRPLERIWGFVVYVLAQKRLLQDPVPGLMHAFIFWGFVALLVTTGNYITNGLVEAVLAWPIGGVLWMLAVGLANVFIGLVLVGLAVAIWRRIVVRPARLALSRDAFIILGLILLVVCSELAGDAMRFVAQPSDPGRTLAVLSGPLSGLLAPIGPSTAAGWFGVFAWVHIIAVLGFGSYLPYSKHLHILTSEPNVYFRNLEPRGALRKMDLEAEGADGEEPVFGARSLKDLTWRHLLDPMSCTECGRCMEFCPASMTGKTLSPKHFMEGLRDQIVMAETALASAASAQRAAKGGAAGGLEASDVSLGLARERAFDALELPLVDNAIPEEAVWQCTTCGWCVEGCPVLIEHVDSIVEIRRNLVL
ncbi:MAG TPA: 4Fe-4S dicluster domain-containing protein, partial [Candidatus Limnocylindria bacterium]|nr:4Fe-4S dicluster domain-containing protein [Candidatus Limnocylindria bacterium]